jgi:putative ABC transport system permease protein
MMGPQGTQNRQMFWRIVRRLLTANRGRLFVILLALGAGAAVTSALLNLQVDAKHRLTTEFRAFGANVLISPRGAGDPSAGPQFLEESELEKTTDLKFSSNAEFVWFLYGIVEVSKSDARSPGRSVDAGKVVLTGFSHIPMGTAKIVPQALVEAEEKVRAANWRRCFVGHKVASALKLDGVGAIGLKSGDRRASCAVYLLPPVGGPEDDQIFLELPATQTLLGQPGRISLIELSVPGTPQQIHNSVEILQREVPDANVHPLTQFTGAQAKIYGRISGLLNITVVIVLALTSLCVMAAMTNVAMERRNDVGLMKAIGGATRRVLRLFLAEAAILGLAGGVIGAAVGIFLSIWLGKQVFGVAAQPRLIVYPVAVALTMIVAILSAYPLRRLAGVRPASVFRGEA